MASAWIDTTTTPKGERRYVVRFRVGGREARKQYGGKFARRADAVARVRWIDGELAAMRVPDLRQLATDANLKPTLTEAAEAWQASRVDVRDATSVQHRVALGRILPVLGTCRIDALTRDDLAQLVADLTGKAYSRESIRKTLTATAMVLDYHDITPNPARDRTKVKLPRQEAPELEPPTAEHVEAVARLLPAAYRLALLALDATGCRVNELALARVGDLDEQQQRWLIRASIAKTRRPRWAALPDVLWQPLIASLPPRDDRDAEQLLFGITDARLRMAITRACRAAAVPSFSPHDLRRRRISLLHKTGMSWAEIGDLVGQRSRIVTADTYTFALLDYREVAYAELLNRPDSAPSAHGVPTPVPTCSDKKVD